MNETEVRIQHASEAVLLANDTPDADPNGLMRIRNYSADLMKLFELYGKGVDLDDENYLPEMHPVVKILLVVILLLVIMVCGFGNTLLAFTIFRLKRLRTVTNLFIASLALSDALVAVLCAPLSLYFYLAQTWIFGEFMCIIVGTVKIVSLNVSVNTLLVIAIERYYVITNPMKPRLSKNCVVLICVLTWLVSSVISIPTAMNIEMTDRAIDRDGNPITYCGEFWGNVTASRAYMLFLTVFEYLLPMVTMAVAYWMIVRKVWFRPNVGNSTPRQRELVCGGRKKMIRMLIIVVASLCLCWGPYYAYNTAVHFNAGILLERNNNMTGYYIVEAIAMSSCVMNTVVFYLLNETFRRESLCLLSKMFCFKVTINGGALNVSYTKNATRTTGKLGTTDANL
ncbi:prokineticin receptor 2-like [Glandiceps talaboti]